MCMYVQNKLSSDIILNYVLQSTLYMQNEYVVTDIVALCVHAMREIRGNYIFLTIENQTMHTSMIHSVICGHIGDLWGVSVPE